ncbi:MAG: hypothetical protein JNM86_04430 [Phycisphaerae bacterium]|nr:hypothetical protein [Phycisphaerae bacterium]
MNEEGDFPSAVFVGMAFGREGCDDVFDLINEVCEDYDLQALRAHAEQVIGSPTIDEVIHDLLDEVDFAIFDLTHERPSVAHEIGMADRELGSGFILLVARDKTPRYANIQGRIVNYYRDLEDLRTILDRQLEAMIDAWIALGDEDGDDLDDDDD